MEGFFNVKRKILIVGLGYRSGLSAANFLAAKGHDVEVSDTKSATDLSHIVGQLDRSVVVHAQNQDPSLLDRAFDCIVLSPGVPARIALVQESRARGIPVISEIELAFQFLKGLTIGITGTDGKSTTTALTTHMLRELGLDARMGGNIGIPLVTLADTTTDDSVTVIELSSYQLETIDTFRPDAAAFTNLTPDHLDRYNSLDDYFNAKMRVVSNQTADDFFIYNLDDERVARGAGTVRSHGKSFSLEREADSFFRDGIIYLRIGDGVKPVLAAKDLFIMGIHNVQNVMTALLLSQSIFEKRKETFPLEKAAAAAKSFPGLSHRMERLGEVKGRLFINDSKATTVGAVEMAIKSLDRPGVFIIGGRAKGDDYSRLAASMKDKVRAVVLIGETKEEFSKLFSSFVMRTATTLDDAVNASIELSREGDAIVLSPACASFDMFTSFEDRGDKFRESVERLKTGAVHGS
ncbi:MAG TPA: UDP-N-acetylmuramoyl-L-alanine--D-glutamate ligase [Spirochaetota bacterium]